MTDAQKTKLAALARSLTGVPYSYGASGEEAPKAFDCSSFVQYLFQEIGIIVPRSSILQAADEQSKEIAIAPDFSNLETGDLVFMRGVRGFYRDSLFGGREISIGHVGIYLGNNEVVHAQQHDIPYGVIIQNIPDLIRDPHYAIVMAKRY